MSLWDRLRRRLAPRSPEPSPLRQLDLQVREAIAEDDEESRLAAIGSSLRERPERERLDLIEGMAQTPDVEVRSAVPKLAIVALGSDAMPLLLRLLHDVDPDVRGYALDAIGVVQPEALAKLVPQLRRQLGSPNDAEALRAAWALVQLRDVDSLSDVEALRDRHRDQPSDARLRAADVAASALADPETVATAIRNHDHEHMPWLGYAASLIDSPECVAALAWGREELPDDACRAACARWVPG